MKKNNDSNAQHDVSKKNEKNKPAKKSSALAAAARGESAVEHAKPNARRDTNGSGGLNNTGTNVSYEESK